MGATARHCLRWLALAAVIGLLVVPALAAGWAAWQGQPWAMDWPQSLRHAAALGAVFCGLRLLLAGAGWLLRLLLAGAGWLLRLLLAGAGWLLRAVLRSY